MNRMFFFFNLKTTIVLLFLLLSSSSFMIIINYSTAASVEHYSTTNLNPYTVLGITKLATKKEIKQSYRKLSLRFHPDKQQQQQQANDNNEKKKRTEEEILKNEQKFMNIQEAYKILIDEEKRRNFDVTGYADLRDLEKEQKRQSSNNNNNNNRKQQSMKRGGWDSEEQTTQTIDSETFDFTSLNVFESIVFNKRKGSYNKNKNNNINNKVSWLIEVFDDSSEPCRRASPSWEQAARALDGFAKFGRINQKLYGELASKVAAKHWMTNEPVAFSKLPAVVGFAQGCRNFWCAHRYRGEMKADELVEFVMDKLLRLKEVPSVTSYELESMRKDFSTNQQRTKDGDGENNKVDFIVFSPRAMTPSPTLRRVATEYSNDINVVRIHHTEREQEKWKLMYGVESAPAVVIIKSESDEVIVKHDISGKESLKLLFAEHRLQLVPEIVSRNVDEIRCKSGGLTRICVLVLGVQEKSTKTETLKMALRSIKKDLQNGGEELNTMKTNLATGLENNEIVFAWIDCAKQKKVCKAVRGSSNGVPPAELRVLRFFSNKPGKMSNELYDGITNAGDIETIYEWIGLKFDESTNQSEEIANEYRLQDEIPNAFLAKESLGLKKRIELLREEISRTLIRVFEESIVAMVEIGPFPIVFMLVLQISLFRFLRNRAFPNEARNTSVQNQMKKVNLPLKDSNETVMNLCEMSESAMTLTKSVYVVLQFINSGEKGSVLDQIKDLQALANKFKSERLLRFAYVDLDQDVSWKAFVNELGDKSVCVWHPSKLKFQKLGNGCSESAVETKLDDVLNGNANWNITGVSNSAWFAQQK